MRLPMASLLEGFVAQFLADYLSNYIKGIQPEQFRLGLWSGVAQFENVELRLEAFDYLQLPIAIREGIVGKLKIQVPWTKLGREPILIALQDVYIYACPREEFEWKSEALEARSLAAKKAKLAAAELSKLSARISSNASGNHSNQSFFTYVSMKLLDNVQVTVENVHFRYTDQKADPEMRFSVGIMFTHLNMNTDHSLSGFPAGKSRSILVNKLVDCRGFSMYWNCNENDSDGFHKDEETCTYLDPEKWTNLIHPFNATVRLMVNKNAPLDGNTSQYSVALETDNLKFTLEDRQLHEMLLLWDALSICKMREKYGRHRPAVGQHGYNRREDGWQKVWWYYAIESVLVDVRKNLRRNSWSYLGWRMDMRRKYVLLYKEKLDFLSRGKPAAAETLTKLEELEKELDLDEILSFRSMAECDLQGQNLEAKVQEEISGSQQDTKSKDLPSDVKVDDQPSTKQRSWLNLLSLGMLGAAGSVTASEQFAGVVPDEIIQGIYEATKYFPSGMKDQGDLPKSLYRVGITCHIIGAVVTLRCREHNEDIASLDMKEIELMAKLWQHSANYFATVKELRVTDLSEKESAYPVVMGNGGMILPYFSGVEKHPRTYAEAVSGMQSKMNAADCLLVLEANVLSADEDVDLAVKIAVQPIEFVYSSSLMKKMSEFFDRPSSLQTFKDLISSSLDRLQSPWIRLQSKAELALAMGKRVSLKVDVQQPVIIYPQTMQSLDCSCLIVVMDLMQIRSIDQGGAPVQSEATDENIQRPNGFEQLGVLQQHSDAASKWFNETIYPAVYSQFEFQLQHVEVILLSHSNLIDNSWKGLSDKDKYYFAKPFDGSGILEICALPDEPALTRFKIRFVMPTLDITLSERKWTLLKLLFSSDIDGVSSKRLNALTVSEGLRGGDNNDIILPSQNSSKAAKLELVLIPKRLSFSWIAPFDTKDSRILHATGENASLLFTHSEHQQKLQFLVDSINMSEVWHGQNAIFSLYSVSRLIVSGSFEPITVWEWDWMTSIVSTAFCRYDQPSCADVALVEFKDTRVFGSWKDGSLDLLKCKAATVKIKFTTCQLDDNIFRILYSCKDNNSWFRYSSEMQHSDELLVCEALDELLGLDVHFFKGKENKEINVGMPFLKLNLHLSSWGRCVHIFSMYLVQTNKRAQEDAVESVANTIEPVMVPPQSQDSMSSFAEISGENGISVVVKSSLICLLICIPDYVQANIHNTSTKIKKSYSYNVHSETIKHPGCDLTEKHISLKTVFLVEKICYRGSLCDINASIHKCEANLIENIDESFQCIPLLRVTDLQLCADSGPKLSIGQRNLGVGVTFSVKKLDIWVSCSVIQFLQSFRFEGMKSTDSTFEFDSIHVKGSLEQGSILLSDGRWNNNAPIFEVRMKVLNSQVNLFPHKLESSSSMQLEVDYHEMEKVAWEPFLEPCIFSINTMSTLKLSQAHEMSFSSSNQLNINITKHLLQAIFRAMDLFSHTPQNLGLPSTNNNYTGYAPYWLQNDTGVCMRYWLGGALQHEDYNAEDDDYGLSNVVQPGTSIPIYIEETMEQVFLKGRASNSSDRLADKKSQGGQHRLIHIQIEGTSNVSGAMSMDLVGAYIFYVNFSHSSKSTLDRNIRKGNSIEGKLSEKGDLDVREYAFCTPVVFEVSCHHFSKIIRIFSTVSLVNATSEPMEVRFDIPFGVLPKVMEPILPGNVVPLPVHLAETGQMRWRPMGSSHIWSEPQSLSHILTLPKQASIRSFISYPVNPKNAIFRCCVMTQENMATSVSEATVADHQHNLPTYSTDVHHLDTSNLTRRKSTNSFYVHSSPHILRDIVFQAPFLFKNCLPLPLTLILESSAGLHLDLSILQGDSKFVLDVNPAQDLVLTLNVPGFLPTKWAIKTAYVSLDDERPTGQNNLFFDETLELLPDSHSGDMLYVKAESFFNLLSGARELTISVPFWFYNCTGVSLALIDEDFETLTKSDKNVKEHFVACLSNFGSRDQSSIEDHCGLQTVLQNKTSESSETYVYDQSRGTSTVSSPGGGKNINFCGSDNNQYGKNWSEPQCLKPHMYSPLKTENLGDRRLKARVAVSCTRRCFLPESESETSWSRPFPLNPPGGVTTIVIPSSEPEGGLILSIVSANTMGASAGKTRTITFQPRFIMANICSKDLCYRQQGSEATCNLFVGSQAHLHWSNMTRPLLVHVRFVEYGWDWSGAFAPDILGDTQLKVRNLVTGATQVLRVEVQNAASMDTEFNGISATDNSLGTYMIVLSDDEGGFMPYRIDNFSVERLRFYQSKCPDFETVLLPYSSCPYIWDEPWRPHHLVLEIPGEGCIGTFDLDEIKEHPSICLPLTHQKPERVFLVSVHAEGAIRVLTFQDMNLHPLRIGVIQGPPNLGLTHDPNTVYKFNLNFSFESVGLSVINLSPQEILFMSAKGVTLQLLQGSHEEKLSMNVSFIQIDNQLPLSQYPVMVMAGSYSPNEHLRESRVGNIPPGDNGGIQFQSSAFTLFVSKWRNLASSVDCYQKIDARLASVQVQLDEHIVSCLVDFVGVLSGSTTHMGHFDNELSPGHAAQNYEFLVDSNTSEFYLIKVLKWKEIYNSWPGPQAVKCAQIQNPKHFRGGRKAYIENLYIAPIEVIISFSSVSWSHGHRGNMQEASLLWRTGGPVQRGLMALIDIEGAPIQMKELSLAHPLARWDAIRGIIIKHYTRQLLHEIYKVLGSAGFLGNPIGFIRSLGSGVRDFVSVPAQSFVKSPGQLMGGFAIGTQSLVSNTVFALSNAATLMSRAAKKGVTAFAIGHQRDQEFQDYGVISELLEGLTGLLQSPVTGAEQHGIPGILSGVALGAVGLIARPVASILELAGRTAQSIRSWSQPIQQAKRVRPPRYINIHGPLLPYSWEEAIGHAVLREAVGSHLQNEVYLTCRHLSDPGKYILLTEKLLLVVRSTDQNASIGPEWLVDMEISIRDILHVERVDRCLNILRGSPVYFPRQKKLKKKPIVTSGPLLHESIELGRSADAEEIADCINRLTDKHLKF